MSRWRSINGNWIDCRRTYKAAVDEWVAAIREEEALASGNHNVAELDLWEAAHFSEHKLHQNVTYRKRLYEDAQRRDSSAFDPRRSGRARRMR